ncbi:hypothetical protein KSP39_PZI013229 [Platanthera zijinensis]|uniref:LRAT domain-containing protein n=1 Tax=Platanthera zijinensis TaxID=2320716 RepID=A0AAP0BDW6_9ASPA
MGLLSSRVERSAIMAGDHIYTWRALFTYSHHGIYVGGQKVVHFTRKKKKTSSSTDSPSSSSSFKPELPPACPIFPDCGFQQPNSGVILSCLDCFLDEGSLHNFEYGVAPSVFLTKVRGGTCTTASSDPPGTVIHRQCICCRMVLEIMTCSRTTARISRSIARRVCCLLTSRESEGAGRLLRSSEFR